MPLPSGQALRWVDHHEDMIHEGKPTQGFTNWMTQLQALHAPNRETVVITVGASPFVYQNTKSYPVNIVVGDGTTTNIDFSRDGVTFYFVNLRMMILGPGDFIRVGYTVVPNMLEVPFL